MNTATYHYTDTCDHPAYLLLQDICLQVNPLDKRQSFMDNKVIAPYILYYDKNFRHFEVFNDENTVLLFAVDIVDDNYTVTVLNGLDISVVEHFIELWK